MYKRMNKKTKNLVPMEKSIFLTYKQIIFFTFFFSETNFTILSNFLLISIKTFSTSGKNLFLFYIPVKKILIWFGIIFHLFVYKKKLILYVLRLWIFNFLHNAKGSFTGRWTERSSGASSWTLPHTPLHLSPRICA